MRQLLGLVCLCWFSACAGSNLEPNGEELLSTSASLRQRSSCGGIAGFVCPEGQRCLMRDEYPDAMGTCVGAPEHSGWMGRCSTVKCLAVACPSGYVRRVTPGNCCGICVPEGQGGQLPEGRCRTAADCEGLVHIMCVGAWSCQEGWCSYQCSSGEIY